MKSEEVVALLRITQLVASGQDVDIVNTIGTYECSWFPPSLFDETSMMRATGTKSGLIRHSMAEAKIQQYEELPCNGLKSTILVDFSFEAG